MRKFLFLTFLLLSALMSVSMSAAGAPVSAQTPVVKGHAPTASGVGITGPATPLAGDTLHLGATFSDPDGDAESGSLLQWYHSDGTAIAGATGQDYVIQDSDAGQRLQAGYTPKTDPLITDPDTGAEVKSALTVLIMGKPDGAKSTFTRDKGTISATGTDKAILTLTLKDSSGNPVSGIAGRLSLAHVPVAGADSVSLTTDDRGNGVYEFSVTGTQPGTVEFTPQLDGAPLATTPATLSLLLTGDSATAQITASDLTVTRNDAAADDSATNQVQAVVTDAAGRPVSGVAVSFTTVAPAHITVSTGVTDVNGVATASLASTQAGPVTVTARINSTGSEQTVDVNFMAGAPSASNSTLTAGASVITANGGGGNGTSLLTLTLKDAKGNLVTGLTDVAFTVAGVADTTLTAVTESPAGSGVYTATLSGTTAGTATVTASAGGAALGGLQVQVSLAADITTAAVRTVTETTGGAKADNVSTNTLTATVEDANGNRVPNATVDWSVTTGIATLNSATSTTDSNGQAVITVKDMTAETATITAKAGSNAADGGQTADTVFSLYPVVSGITQGVNNSPADNTTQNTLTVQIADLAGNALTNQAVTLSLSGSNLGTGPATLKNGANALTAASTSYAVTTDANGQVMLTATDVTAETISVSVKTSTSTQAAVTKTSTFALYPVLSSLTAGANNVPANNTTTNSVIATFTDKKGTALAAGTVVTFTFSLDKGTARVTNATAPTWTGAVGAGGQVTFLLADSSATAEAVTLTGYVQGSAIDQKTASVNFVAYTLSNISVNGASFTTSQGFPTTGFTGAKFQLLMNGVTTWNGDYNWSTNQTGWTSVDTGGTVTFTGTATTATKSVTITATPKEGGAPARTYSFTVSNWYRATTTSTYTYSAAVTYCSGLGGVLPTRLNLINTNITSGSVSARGVGYLWGEFGHISSSTYPLASTGFSVNWTRTNDATGTSHYFVWMSNPGSAVVSTNADTVQYPAVCRVGL
ncbi:TPA: invasin domain 3-containing protein [Citrobacter amalonaticus]